MAFMKGTFSYDYNGDGEVDIRDDWQYEQDEADQKAFDEYFEARMNSKKDKDDVFGNKSKKDKDDFFGNKLLFGKSSFDDDMDDLDSDNFDDDYDGGDSFDF